MEALIFQTLVFMTYVLWVTIKYGILTSISESYYHIKEKGLFTLFCFLLGFPMFTYSRAFHPEAALPGDYSWLFFLSMLLAFTGAAADYKRTLTDVIHFTGAAVAILAALLGLWLQYGLWVPGAVCLAISLFLLPSYNRVFWIENVAFACVLGGGILIN